MTAHSHRCGKHLTSTSKIVPVSSGKPWSQHIATAAIGQPKTKYSIFRIYSFMAFSAVILPIYNYWKILLIMVADTVFSLKTLSKNFSPRRKPSTLTCNIRFCIAIMPVENFLLQACTMRNYKSTAYIDIRNERFSLLAHYDLMLHYSISQFIPTLWQLFASCCTVQFFRVTCHIPTHCSIFPWYTFLLIFPSSVIIRAVRYNCKLCTIFRGWIPCCSRFWYNQMSCFSSRLAYLQIWQTPLILLERAITGKAVMLRVAKILQFYFVFLLSLSLASKVTPHFPYAAWLRAIALLSGAQACGLALRYRVQGRAGWPCRRGARAEDFGTRG